ncbi:MAG: hypothetical protein ACREL9_01865 [Gemmatimonadales bacterium]
MNDDIIGLVAVILLFGGGTLFLLSISPIGKAVAARMLGRTAPVLDDDEVNEDLKRLRDELAASTGGGAALEDLRREVAELAERLDFHERLLAKQRDPALPAPRGGEERHDAR